MPLEFQMQDLSLETEVPEIEEALQQMWEPFAVHEGRVFFKRMFQNEDRELRSSTREENKVIWVPPGDDDGA